MGEETGSQKISVLIADSYRVSREELCLLVNNSTSCQLIGVSSGCTETLEMAKKFNPEVCLINISSLMGGGKDLVACLLNAVPAMRSICVGAPLDQCSLTGLFHAGIWGYIPPFAPIKHILKAITAVHKGELWVERKVFRTLLLDGASPIEDFKQLTTREQEVFKQVCKGCSNMEISEILCVSDKTIRSHLSHLYEKIGVKTRSQLIIRGLKFSR